MSAAPHITVATVVERDQRFLMVQERADGRIVYNQPAGHLEPGESLVAAAERETLEETRWQVRISHFLGIYHYVSADNGVCYVRHCFIAEPVAELTELELDRDILKACWLSAGDIEDLQHQHRGPMVGKVIADYRAGIRFPLELINDQQV